MSHTKMEDKGAAEQPTPSKATRPSGFLTAEMILAADDITYEDVDVPEWGGGKVRLRLLNAAESMHFQGQLETNRKEAALALFRASVVDPVTGLKLFQESEVFKALRKKSMKVIRRLSDKCLELNGLLDPGREAQLAAKLLREAAVHERDEVASRLNDIADQLVRGAEEGDLGN
ncbi:hypothetical protein LCGC14_2168400 [marine sediment metagenome]|uniref:Uncharacterized protein n=1 Tax=marine sediment metagenome TaxID=412755 RepID=A0A0F9DQV2_9ZZZZ